MVKAKLEFINYLQQPSSIYALMGLIMNSKAEGKFSLKDVIDWFQSQNAQVNVDELKQRWRELMELGFAEYVPSDSTFKWNIRVGRRIGYVLTEKGDKAAEALMEAVNYIKKL
jgi:hypothetical protein